MAWFRSPELHSAIQLEIHDGLEERLLVPPLTLVYTCTRRAVPLRDCAVKAMYENGIDCLIQSPGFGRRLCQCLGQNKGWRQTSMGFKKVRLTCMSQASAETMVCVGVTVTIAFSIS